MRIHVLMTACVLVGTSACGGDDGPGGAGAGDDGASSNVSTAGGGGATGGVSAGDTSTATDDAQCINAGEQNIGCPVNVGPIRGSCAPHGECCHRASNVVRMDALGADDPAVFEYRLNFVEVINHPLTISQPVLVQSAAQRADTCSGEQCLLWRFTAPRAGGQLVAGPGTVEIGIGAYNCDGTYSYYGPDAAPPREGISDDPGRWQSEIVDAEFDPAESDIDQFHIPWATNKNREVVRSIFLDPVDNTIDWELASSGFEITTLGSNVAGDDCMGARNSDGVNWDAIDGFVSYSPIEDNDHDINNLISQQYCQLLAFGIVEDKSISCHDTERCMPGTDGCPYVKLPDSLCPQTDGERDVFGCHLGAEGNPNGEEGYPDALNCTQDAPTAPLDPDVDPGVSDGQCCDPLGQSATLPACNAYRTVQVFVAAAAEITDEPRDDIPPVCD